MRGAFAALCLFAISACQGNDVDGRFRLATPRMAAAISIVGDRFYVVGGVTRNGSESIVDECEPSTRFCVQKASLATGVGGASAAELDGLLYVAGGRDAESVLDRLLVYTPSSDAWVSKKSMPTARWNHMSAAVAGKIYVFGGVMGTGSARRVLADVVAYHPVRDEWEPVGTMPDAVQAAAVATVNGKVYLIGGRTETQPTATSSAASIAVREFDPQTASWRSRRPMPTGRTGAAAAVRDGRIFVVGGAAAGQALAVVEVYDPIADTWTNEARLQTARTGHGAASIEGRLYVIAGAGKSESDLIPDIEELPR